MFYRIVFIFTLIFNLSHATTFKEVNPKPTKTMLENQKNAHLCPHPIEAKEEISEEFKYGCFCGKDYPKVDKNDKKDFRDLNETVRLERIEKLFKIKPYDDLDTVCMQHDICYLYQGKEAKVCNRAIYDDLSSISDTFEEKNATLENEQCMNLADDMASVFQTFFTLADDEDSLFDLGISMMTTGITVTNKFIQESVDTINDQGDRYPKNGHRCLINEKLEQK